MREGRDKGKELEKKDGIDKGRKEEGKSEQVGEEWETGWDWIRDRGGERVRGKTMGEGVGIVKDRGGGR